MTKKIVSCKWLVLGVLIVLCSCVTAPIVFDETLPVEQTARIYLYPGLEVKAYNGIEVPFKTIMGAPRSEWHDVILPAGEAEFLLDVRSAIGYDQYVTVGNTFYTAKNVAFKYTFEAGKPYSIVFSINDDSDWGVSIYEMPPQAGLSKKATPTFMRFYKIN